MASGHLLCARHVLAADDADGLWTFKKPTVSGRRGEG